MQAAGADGVISAWRMWNKAQANHHGNKDSSNAFFVGTLRPRVFLIPVWSSDHPGHRVLARPYSTRLYPGPLLDRLKSDQGLFLIRVDRGGATYHVIILDDSAET